MNQVQKLVFKMLKENTGRALCDSGGAYGRHWERNQNKDLVREPAVITDASPDDPSDEWSVTVSLYHYLPQFLELDEVCNEYNKLLQLDWDSEIYGVSKDAHAWLMKKGFGVADDWNSYNGDHNLSQTIQGTNLTYGGSRGEYVLLQIHGGCDVRGGYTDAKLFKYADFQEFIDPCPRVYATLYRENGEQVDLETQDGGYGFVTVDPDGMGNGVAVTMGKNDTIEVYL